MRKKYSSIRRRRRTALAPGIAVLAPILNGVSPVEKQLSQRFVPSIFVSVESAELILLEDQPVYAPVAGTSLLWVSNTESDLFRLGATGAFYPVYSWYPPTYGFAAWYDPIQGRTVGGRQSMVHMAVLADRQPITRARGHTRVVAPSMDHTVARVPLAESQPG